MADLFFIVALFAAVGFLIYFYMANRIDKAYHYPKGEDGKSEEQIKVITKSGKIRCFVSKKGVTDWKEYPFLEEPAHFEPCDVQKLMQIRDYCKMHGNPYPTAHKNKEQ